MSDRIEDFKPRLTYDSGTGPIYAEMLIEMVRCSACATPMLATRTRPSWKPSWPFPNYMRVNLEAQLARGWWSVLVLDAVRH